MRIRKRITMMMFFSFCIVSNRTDRNACIMTSEVQEEATEEVLFCRAAGDNSSKPENETSNIEQEVVSYSVESAAVSENSETEEYIEKDDVTETENSESELTEEQRAELNTYYGTYRVTEFFPTVAFLRRYLDNFIQETETDMLLGQIIELTPERFVIYDVGKKEFDNYIMERYIVIGED